MAHIPYRGTSAHQAAPITSDPTFLIWQVALGIYYLHEFDPPVLHLDLKSANVLIDDAGIAKVCDFGMSHVLEDAAEARRGSTSHHILLLR